MDPEQQKNLEVCSFEHEKVNHGEGLVFSCKVIISSFYFYFNSGLLLFKHISSIYNDITVESSPIDLLTLLKIEHRLL